MVIGFEDQAFMSVVQRLRYCVQHRFKCPSQSEMDTTCIGKSYTNSELHNDSHHSFTEAGVTIRFAHDSGTRLVDNANIIST